MSQSDKRKLAESLPAEPEQEPCFSVHRGIFGETIHLTDSRGNVQSIAVQGGLFGGNCKTCGCVWITRERVRDCPICPPVAPVAAKEKVCAATPDGKCLATKDDTIDCCAPDCLAEPKPTPSAAENKIQQAINLIEAADRTHHCIGRDHATMRIMKATTLLREVLFMSDKSQPDSSSILDDRNIAKKLMMELFDWVVVNFDLTETIQIGETPVKAAIRIMESQREEICRLRDSSSISTDTFEETLAGTYLGDFPDTQRQVIVALLRRFWNQAAAKGLK